MNKRYLAKLGSPITRPSGDLPKLGGKLHEQGAQGGHGGPLTSVREATHKGREIVITTTYTITIDGKQLTAHVEVDNLGRVHCHGLPNYNFPSALDMVKAIIDSEPETYPKPTRPKKPTKPTKPTKPAKPDAGGGGTGDHDHGEHDHHDHSDHGGGH